MSINIAIRADVPLRTNLELKSQREHGTSQVGEQQTVASNWTSKFDVDKDNLASVGKNDFFVLGPGYTLRYESEDETLKITVLPETKVVVGVENMRRTPNSVQ